MGLEGLNGPQKVVVRLIAQGCQDSRSLKQAGLSQAEFDRLLKQLFQQLGVTSRVELILCTYSRIAISTGGEKRVHSVPVEQKDGGTAKEAALPDATNGGFESAGEWAA